MIALNWHKIGARLAFQSNSNNATGKISSYIAQGYSHANGYEGAYFYDSALGASRAARNWYYSSRHILAQDVVSHRLKLINHIIRQLLLLISQQRGHQIREETSQYDTTSLTDVLNHVPMMEGVVSEGSEGGAQRASATMETRMRER